MAAVRGVMPEVLHRQWRRVLYAGEGGFSDPGRDEAAAILTAPWCAPGAAHRGVL